MNPTTINKYKRFGVKCYSRIFIILGLVLIAASMFIRHVVVDKPVSIDVGRIENKINDYFVQTQSIASQWLTSNDDSLFLARYWKLGGTPEQWGERRLSLLLYENDSLVLWSNEVYFGNSDQAQLSDTSIFIQDGGTKSIYKKKTNGDKSVVAVLELQSDMEGLNKEVFSTDKLNLRTIYDLDYNSNLISVNNGLFYIEPHIEKDTPFTACIMSWLGLLLFILGIKRFFRVRTKVDNVVLISGLFFGFIISFGLLLVTTDIFMSKNSFINSISIDFWHINISLIEILIIYVLVLIYSNFLHKVRHKIMLRYYDLSSFKKNSLLLSLLIFINLIMIFFHYSMVNILSNTAINIEVYKFTLIDQGTVLFYFICALFVTSRILLNAVVKSVFRNNNMFKIFFLSMSILIIMMLVISDDISSTGYILLAFNSIFLISVFFEKKNSTFMIFIGLVFVFTSYVMLLVTIESNKLMKETVKAYSERLLDNKQFSEEEVEKYRKLTYFKIGKYDIDVKEDNSFDLQKLILVLEDGVDTAVNINGFTHYIFHHQNTENNQDDLKTIIVSKANMTILDYAAFFVYIYIFLFFVVGSFLRMAGYDYRNPHKGGSIVKNIRIVVISIIILAMALVFLVIMHNTFENYRTTQRQIINNQMRTLTYNFKQYEARESGTQDELLRGWFEYNSKLTNKTLILYDIEGNHIMSSQTVGRSHEKMQAEAYSNLRWHNAPYFNKNEHYNNSIYKSAYIPIYHENQLLGYVCMIQFDRGNHMATDPRFDPLINILNIFMVVIFIVIIISMSLYRVLTLPLNRLYQGMSEISLMHRIDEIEGNDEVAVLIRQYNHMIDYLKESYEALARTEREVAWREMARQVAHEIKNPLTPMKLKIQMLQRSKAQGDTQLSDKIDNTLDVLLQQIDLLASMANEFSDFARIREAEVEYLDVSKLLNAINELYSVNDHNSFIVEPISEKLVIRADYSQIMRVLINLCQNAIQAIASKPDGRIVLQVKRVRNDVVFRITDNGIGISKEVSKKIFQPNFTTKTGGSGLGLALSRQIILNSGGTIYFDSEEGDGTTFTITLPYFGKDR